jgi:hypothetical protein
MRDIAGDEALEEVADILGIVAGGDADDGTAEQAGCGHGRKLAIFDANAIGVIGSSAS